MVKCNSKPNLSAGVRNRIAQHMLQCLKPNGKVKKGSVSLAAATFHVDRKTVSTIWKEGKLQRLQGLPIHVTNKKRGVMRKRKLTINIDQIKAIPFSERRTLRALGKKIGISAATLCRWKKLGLIRAHTNAIKPQVSAEHKLKRLHFCLEALHLDILMNAIKFKSMKHVVHIDEKWFYLTRASEKYYTCPDEEVPYRACVNKKYIGKIMFMSVVSRPVYNTDGSLVFDGKIGLFPFTHVVPAARTSKHRAAGTMELKPIPSITKEVVKNCMINQVIPAIKAKWPLGESTFILIQQDNAKPHILDTDPEFRAAASSDGFDIHLYQQPPLSPDLNINDLGWFMSLQTLQLDTGSYTLVDLMRSVLNSFETLSHTTLNKVFLSLQACMIEIIKHRGHNNYALPHLAKDRLLREGNLPEDMQVEAELVLDGYDYLKEAGGADGMEGYITSLGMNDFNLN